MLHAHLLLGFAAIAAAIDIRFLYEDTQGDCGGGYGACVGRNPLSCCTATGRYYGSVNFVAVPPNWVITAKGYRGYGCSETLQNQAVGRGHDVCLGHVGPSYSGAYYVFGDSKRSESEECEETHRIDQVGLGDGTVFDVVGLSDDEIHEM